MELQDYDPHGIVEPRSWQNCRTIVQFPYSMGLAQKTQQRFENLGWWFRIWMSSSILYILHVFFYFLSPHIYIKHLSSIVIANNGWLLKQNEVEFEFNKWYEFSFGALVSTSLRKSLCFLIFQRIFLWVLHRINTSIVLKILEISLWKPCYFYVLQEL